MAKRKRPAPASFITWVTGFYRDYLNEMESDGGWCEDYVTKGLREVVRDPEATGINAALLELAAKTMRSIWHDDPVGEQPDLFSVAGIELEGTYTWADPHVPGFHRRVLSRWATPRHVERDALLAKSKAQEGVAAAKIKEDNAARIMARIGDPDALLWDHRDGMGAPFYGTTGRRPHSP